MDTNEQLELLDDLLLGPVKSIFPAPLTQEERVAVNAYLVLSHAVLEEQLEEAFERHFERLVGWARVDAGMVPREVAVLAFAASKWTPEGTLKSWKSRSLFDSLRGSFGHFRKQLRNNNGIKERNVETLARSIGLEWGSFEQVLSQELADLTTLGARRGEAGHLSPFSGKAVILNQQEYPEDARRWVRAAGAALARIIRHLDSLIVEQQPNTLICDWDGN
ncbi:MAG TPA: hypothetical protein PK132_12650 [Dermatophilaceae bacterium]|nr:hypothetical protein [Dermatophilaceae bacterium]HOR16580.1 hypothetical protein [Dermatophilaceae bacterium]HPK90390.1 hypothetical protein [Dermatophilaceae bacterium]